MGELIVRPWRGVKYLYGRLGATQVPRSKQARDGQRFMSASFCQSNLHELPLYVPTVQCNVHIIQSTSNFGPRQHDEQYSTV